MAVDLPLQQMSLSAKMELLEALWDNLSRAPDQVESPEWHKDILEERRQRLQSGEETVSDWEGAKEDIRRRIS
jgi:small-conductance mechanosensitive channel